MGRDKALIVHGGRTLLERAVSELAAVSQPVMLACGSQPRYAELGLPLALDREGGLGPLAGLEAGLSAAGEGWVLCLACDMPGAGGALLRALVARARAARCDAALLSSARGVEPLCGVYHTRLLGPVRAALAAGERKMTSLFAHPLPDGRLPRLLAVDAGEFGAEGALWNLNAPADLGRTVGDAVGGAVGESA
jgi:molybdopterin-guanine dinucleotide biosynthesis protein A